MGRWSVLPRPTAHRPPLYPLLLSFINRDLRAPTSSRVALCHLLLGLATVLLTYELGRRWQLGVLSYIAAVIVACDPILLQQSTLVMTETLAAFLTAVALLCFTRYSQRPEVFTAALAGGAVGLATLCRPTYLPWLALAAILVLFLGRTTFRGRVLATTALILGAAVILAPWGWRNYRDLKIISVTTTHGGYTLWLGNNPEFYAHLRSGRSLETFTPIGQPGLMQSIGDNRPFEVVYDEVLYGAAREAIRNEPAMFTYACCYRLWQLVNPLPHPEAKKRIIVLGNPAAGGESGARTALRYLVAAWYLAVYLLAAFGLYKLRSDCLKAPWIWGFALCLAFAGVHAFYWTNLRMRGPLMPFVALVAAAGVVHLAEPFVHANLLRRKNLRSC